MFIKQKYLIQFSECFIERTSHRTAGHRLLLRWFIAITTQLLKTHGLKNLNQQQNKKVHRKILKYLVFCAFYLMVARKIPRKIKADLVLHFS